MFVRINFVEQNDGSYQELEFNQKFYLDYKISLSKKKTTTNAADVCYF